MINKKVFLVFGIIAGLWATDVYAARKPGEIRPDPNGGFMACPPGETFYTFPDGSLTCMDSRGYEDPLGPKSIRHYDVYPTAWSAGVEEDEPASIKSKNTPISVSQKLNTADVSRAARVNKPLKKESLTQSLVDVDIPEGPSADDIKAGGWVFVKCPKGCYGKQTVSGNQVTVTCMKKVEKQDEDGNITISEVPCGDVSPSVVVGGSKK